MVSLKRDYISYRKHDPSIAYKSGCHDRLLMAPTHNAFLSLNTLSVMVEEQDRADGVTALRDAIR